MLTPEEQGIMFSCLQTALSCLSGKYFPGIRKAALDEFNTLGKGSKTVICHLLSVWPIANAVATKFSTCEKRKICDSALIHVKKHVVDLYCSANQPM